jgi:hypothetical protein
MVESDTRFEIMTGIMELNAIRAKSHAYQAVAGGAVAE